MPTGFTTGAKKHPLYEGWVAMRQRCTSPAHKNYSRYGGRGIKVCQEWENFWTFVSDMGPKPSLKHSVDRIDNDGPYAPWNCRWATQKQQCTNSSIQRFITYQGETRNASYWANHFGICRSAISNRIRKYGLDNCFHGLTRAI